MKPLKDVYTEKELDKLSRKDSLDVVANYEYVVEHEKPFKVKYVKKSLHYNNPEDIVTDPMCDLSFLEGATIKKTGFHKNAREGGLGIVYEKDGVEKVAVLGFTELGMWIYANVETK